MSKRGSHDRWLDDSAHETWQETIDGQHVVVCHYAMRAWPRSHHNSWQLYGHSQGKLEPIGKQWGVGVDNDFYPVSFERARDHARSSRQSPPGRVRVAGGCGGADAVPTPTLLAPT